MDDGDLVDRITERFDVEALAAALDRRSEELVDTVRARVREAVAARDTKELLTLTVRHEDGRMTTLAPAVSKEYARTLFAFVRDRAEGDTTLLCAAEHLVDSAVQDAVLEFYEAPAAVQVLTDQVSHTLRADVAVLGLVTERFRELRGGADGDGRFGALGSAGTSLGASVGALATAAASRSVALAPIKAVVSRSVLGAAAAGGLQATSAAAGKHAVATAAVKSSLAKVAGIAGGHAVLGPVMVAVVGAVLVHEYRAFPTKMAIRVSTDVASELGKQVARMHRDFLMDYVRSSAGVYVSSIAGLADHVAGLGRDGGRIDDDELARLVDEYQLLQRAAVAAR